MPAKLPEPNGYTVLSTPAPGHECPYCYDQIEPGRDAYLWPKSGEQAHASCHEDQKAALRRNLENPKLRELTAKAQNMTLPAFNRLRPWIRERYLLVQIDTETPEALCNL